MRYGYESMSSNGLLMMRLTCINSGDIAYYGARFWCCASHHIDLGCWRWRIAATVWLADHVSVMAGLRRCFVWYAPGLSLYLSDCWS